ncbi:MAG TPA: hypothetical protein PLB62_07920 [Candidatus Sumerlaeota bacterium]|nr:hypothetical protein [Candidatus Sumerlaeota bacterium]
MISVHVCVSGILLKPRGLNEFDLELARGSTVRDSLVAAGYAENHIPRIMTVVDGVLRPHHHVLESGQNVVLSIVIGGG